MTLTQKQALAAIRSTGASVRVSDGEYRVNVPGGREASAYYTSDPQDAIYTAKEMMKPHFGRIGKKSFVRMNL